MRISDSVIAAKSLQFLYALQNKDLQKSGLQQ